MNAQRPLAVIRGSGELGTGAGHALFRRGMRLLALELPLPRVLRLGVAFAAAAVEGRVRVEGVEAVHCRRREDVEAAWALGVVPLWTADPGRLVPDLEPAVLVDARMRSVSEPLTRKGEAPVVLGIGPGFEAGKDVHFVIESRRGPRLGAVIRSGRAEAHDGMPGDVLGHREERLLRAPRAGRFERVLGLGDFVEPGDVVGTVEGEPVRARLRGMVRGLKLAGVPVGERHKVGDVDPRRDRTLLVTMSDKARAVGRGAVAALVQAGVLAPQATERGSLPCT